MYGKLFTQMYDGTLGTTGPWEALVTFQQLIILADKNGEVDMTAGAIAKRTTIPLNIIERGIQELMKPDPDSRSPDEDGRRIIHIDEHRSWGWKIVNHGHYRKIRSEDERREYHRQYAITRREREKDVNKESTIVNTSTPDNPKHRCSKQEADTDIEARAKATVRQVAQPDGFEDFWSLYPNRKGKKAARKAWSKIKQEQRAALMAALPLQVAHDDAWLRGFVPMPTTYLNGERWNDALSLTQHNGVAVSQPSKTLTAIQKLEGMKHGLANPRADDRLPKTALLGVGSNAGD